MKALKEQRKRKVQVKHGQKGLVHTKRMIKKYIRVNEDSREKEDKRRNDATTQERLD